MRARKYNPILAALSNCLIIVGTWIHIDAQAADKFPPRKPRSECFFGIHFDLHANETNDQIGLTLTEGMIDTFLSQVKPDFIQVDCKGHPGISSYPTKVGFPAAGFIRDPMKLWRKKTAEYGVGLNVHFSGVYDKKVIQVHPDWAIVNPDGSIDEQNTSVFSPYSDTYLIPQLKELSDVYHIDGAWIDGECWAIRPDYSDRAIQAFQQETGITQIPRHPDDENYYAFLEFNRRKFVDYIDHYVSTIHAHNPNFQITSNWAYSSLMPEKVTLKLDYLSGDLQATNSVYSAAFEARCLAPQGLPWDLMAWSFVWDPAHAAQRSTKSAAQLMQEAAEVMAMGGGIQFYFKQNNDLSIQPWTINIMKELAEFCRQRELCQKSQPVPQIALVYATEAFKRKINRIYAGGWFEPASEPIKGCLNALLGRQNAVEVLMEHHLKGRMQDYGLIIWPEWHYIDPDFKTELLDYVANGGKLIVIGIDAVRLFEQELGIETSGEGVNQRSYISHDQKMAMAASSYLPVSLKQDVRKMAWFYQTNDFRYRDQYSAASISDYGKGKIAGVYLNLGQSYYQGHNPVLRDFLDGIVDQLFPNPLVQLEGTGLVHVGVSRKANQLLINLINTAGNHADRYVAGFDEIPPVGPIFMKVSVRKKPSQITLVPGSGKMKFTYRDGQASLVIPKLDIHQVVVID